MFVQFVIHTPYLIVLAFSPGFGILNTRSKLHPDHGTITLNTRTFFHSPILEYSESCAMLQHLSGDAGAGGFFFTHLWMYGDRRATHHQQ